MYRKLCSTSREKQKGFVLNRGNFSRKKLKGYKPKMQYKALFPQTQRHF